MTVMDVLSMTDGAENDVHWQALEALKNESTLEERAENFKVFRLSMSHPSSANSLNCRLIYSIDVPCELPMLNNNDHTCMQIQGNNKLKIGLQAEANKHVLREAIDFYSKGLELKCSDTKLNSILLSNRAHVDSLIGERVRN